jgi:hypothetical protein
MPLVIVMAKPAAENLGHGLALGEFVHEFVKEADLLHQRVFDVFNPHAADDPGDQVAVGVHRRSLCEERVEVDLLLEDLRQPGPVVARQPADNFIYLFFRPPFPFRLVYVVRIHRGERRGEDAMASHACPLVGAAAAGNDEHGREWNPNNAQHEKLAT